jgi:orotidine-5'-phosphate decarboxylase
MDNVYTRMRGKDKVFFALDYSDDKEAVKVAKKLAPHVAGFKIGLEFFTAYHWKGVEKIQKLDKPIFLDLKLHDIPNTVGRAVKNVSEHGVDYLSVHIAGGEHMLDAAMDNKGDTKITGITLLTSIADPCSVGIHRVRYSFVTDMAKLAKKCKLDSFVCSGHDLHFVGAHDLIKFVPGIRLPSDDANDQQMVFTPEKAVNLGSDYLVMGRSILNSANPIKTLQSINSL